MNTLIDGFYVGRNYSRGMARYAENLALALGIHQVEPAGKFKKYGAWFFPIWEQFFVIPESKRAGCTVLISPYNTAPLFSGRIDRVIVIHDLIFMRESFLFGSGSLKKRFGSLYRRMIAPYVARRARLVITVSEYSKKEIIRQLGISAEKIFVVPNTYTRNFSSNTTLPTKVGKIFTVAGDSRSKNLAFLLAAFSHLKQQHVARELVIAGVPESSWSLYRKNLAIGQLELGKDVIFLPRVDDSVLFEHYATCDVYVCASLEEGFGIPLLEAMAAGALVVSSNKTSLPEVGGDAALYFDPADLTSCVGAIRQALSMGEDERSVRRSAGFDRCKNYSFQNFKDSASHAIVESLA